MSLLLDYNYNADDEKLSSELKDRLRTESFEEAKKNNPGYCSFDDIYDDAMSIYREKVKKENLSLSKDKESSKNAMLIRVASSFYELVRISYELFHKNEPSSETKFEIMVYAEYILLIELNRSIKDNFDIFSALTNKWIKEWADENTITNKLPCEYFDFINDRFTTYRKEFVAISDASNTQRLPLNIIRNIYGEPLQRIDAVIRREVWPMSIFEEWADSQKSLKRLFQESIDHLIKESFFENYEFRKNSIT